LILVIGIIRAKIFLTENIITSLIYRERERETICVQESRSYRPSRINLIKYKETVWTDVFQKKCKLQVVLGWEYEINQGLRNFVVK
jgi:hypothetical protein